MNSLRENHFQTRNFYSQSLNGILSKHNLQMMEERRSGKARNLLFGILACQSVLVEEFLFAACYQSWMAFIAKEKAVRVSGNCEARERPEASCWWPRINFCRTLKANHRFWVASFEQHIGPVASVNFLIINQALGARQLIWNAEFAFDVARWTVLAVFVESKLIFTARCWDCSG